MTGNWPEKELSLSLSVLIGRRVDKDWARRRQLPNTPYVVRTLLPFQVHLVCFSARHAQAIGLQRIQFVEFAEWFTQKSKSKPD